MEDFNYEPDLPEPTTLNIGHVSIQLYIVEDNVWLFANEQMAKNYGVTEGTVRGHLQSNKKVNNMTKLTMTFFTIIILIMVKGCHSGIKHYYVYPATKEIPKEELCIIELWRPQDNTPLWPLAVNGIPFPEYRWTGKKDKRYIYLIPGRHRIKYSYVSETKTTKVIPRWIKAPADLRPPPEPYYRTDRVRSITENCLECDAGNTYFNEAMEYDLKQNCGFN